MSQSGAGYIPMVTNEELQRIRRWHDSAYELTRSEAGSGREFTYLGTSYASKLRPSGIRI